MKIFQMIWSYIKSQKSESLINNLFNTNKITTQNNKYNNPTIVYCTECSLMHLGLFAHSQVCGLFHSSSGHPIPRCRSILFRCGCALTGVSRCSRFAAVSGQRARGILQNARRTTRTSSSRQRFLQR